MDEWDAKLIGECVSGTLPIGQLQYTLSLQLPAAAGNGADESGVLGL